jgi:hypothetical protein
MTRKNDPTALLPFPARPIDATAPVSRDAVRDTTRRGRRRVRRAPVQLDQLDLADLVRHHATRRAALRGPASGLDSPSRETPSRETPSPDRGCVGPLPAITVDGGFAADPTEGSLTEGSLTEGALTEGATVDLCAGAVRRDDVHFYLDLLGAVTVMALVLLAAILV